jgi:TolB-like protein
VTTPDIFLSYNREDAATAKCFADAFAAEGLNVWWDATLRSGEAYDEVTEAALRGAKAVVVLWSPRSVVSRWVRAEATIADRCKTLVPVTIEACERPIMFELTQTAELSHWTGDAADRAWQTFLADVRRFVGSVAAPAVAAPPGTPAPSLHDASLVVLPFVNMGGDPEQEYFADGITEDLITDLSKVPNLRVISRNSAFFFKGKHVDVIDVSRQLNVGHVLEGSIRRAGNRVRVTAQLIDGSTNDHVWAERWDREMADIFDLQDELTAAIVAALKLKLVRASPGASTDRGTTNLEAYDHYIRARALHSTMGLFELEQAISLYRQATDLDPGFAQAWLGFALALQNWRVYEPDRVKIRWGEVLHAYRRAAEISPDSADVVSIGVAIGIWDYDWSGIADALAGLAAVAGQPTTLGSAQLSLGQAQAAVDRVIAGRQSDPLSIGASFVLQYTLDAAGRLDDAQAEYERSKGLLGPRVTMEWRAATRALARGDRESARCILAERFGGNTHFMPFLPRLLEVFDQPDAALAILHEAHDDPGCSDGARQMAIANLATSFGDSDLAFAAIRRGLVEQKHGIAFPDLWFPNLAPLRRDSRFRDIVREVGLVDYWRKSGNWGDFARPLGEDDFEMIG